MMARPEIMPEGESLRNAIRWMSARRLEEPNISATKLIEEAGPRFDLSPRETEFLRAYWSQSTDQPD